MVSKTGIYVVVLAMILMKSILPGEKTEIVPFPRQSVFDGGSFVFDRTTVIGVENAKQAVMAKEAAVRFGRVAGFVPKVVIRERRADILFRTDMRLPSEHYKLRVVPSCILLEASDEKGFFYAIQTLRFLLPTEINGRRQIAGVRWSVPGVAIQDGPRYGNRVVVLHTPSRLIPEGNLKVLVSYMAVLKINRLHFLQGDGDAMLDHLSGSRESVTFAESGMVTLSSGATMPCGAVFDLPYHTELLVSQTSLSGSEESKRQLFQELSLIAQQCW